MGWWNSKEDGTSLYPEGTGMMWGDGPADTMDYALDQIVKDFTRNVGRKPTEKEIMAGVLFSLSALELEKGTAS